MGKCKHIYGIIFAKQIREGENKGKHKKKEDSPLLNI
jgi:hypothetical protein